MLSYIPTVKTVCYKDWHIEHIVYNYYEIRPQLKRSVYTSQLIAAQQLNEPMIMKHESGSVKQLQCSDWSNPMLHGLSETLTNTTGHRLSQVDENIISPY